MKNAAHRKHKRRGWRERNHRGIGIPPMIGRSRCPKLALGFERIVPINTTTRLARHSPSAVIDEAAPTAASSIPE